MTFAQAQVYALVVIITSSAVIHADAQFVDTQNKEQNKENITNNKEQTKVVLTQEQKAVALLRDFITLTKKNQNKTFAQYCKELIALLKGNPTFTPFIEGLDKVRDCKDPILISLFLNQQQKQLPESIKAVFKSKDPKELMKILRSRLK